MKKRVLLVGRGTCLLAGKVFLDSLRLLGDSVKLRKHVSLLDDPFYEDTQHIIADVQKVSSDMKKAVSGVIPG